MNEQNDKARVSTGNKDLPEFTLLGDDDLYLFNEGSHLSLYEKLGAHPCQVKGVAGAYFAVWAPNAERVTIMGDW
jgi:1,4-alpha-glucan branching enzyme